MAFIRKASVLLSPLILLSIFSSAQAAVVQFNVSLSGSAEVPGPGDANGSGLAILRIDNVANTINWNITTNNIAPITGAHIHKAVKGASGPIVVNFNNQLSGSNLYDADLASVLADSHGFYVNIHTGEYESGAIRGQLCNPVPAPVPVPAAAWLFGSGLMGLVGVMRRRTSKNK